MNPQTSPEVRLLGVPNTYSQGMTGGFWMSRVLSAFFVAQDVCGKPSKYQVDRQEAGGLVGNQDNQVSNEKKHAWSFYTEDCTT